MNRIPMCLHTCFHCAHAVIVEEYVFPSSRGRILFDRCWKKSKVRTPLPREEYKEFKENGERIKRKFWKKWEGKVCTCFGKHVEEEVEFESKDELVNEQEDEKTITGDAEEVDNSKTVDQVSEEENVEYGNINKESKTKEENKYPLTTRMLVLKALAAGLHHLGEIAVYAGVDPSTALVKW